MIKYLIAPLFALALSFSVQAQARFGLAFDYEHIQAPRYENIGSGSGYGGSFFVRAPFSSHWGLDGSLDIAAGHTQTDYPSFSPSSVFSIATALVTQRRSFVSTTLPLHIVYSLSFQNVRVFAGPGLAFSHIQAEEYDFHGLKLDPNCSMLIGSVRAGCQLYQHVVLSGEFRFFKAYLSNDNNRVSNFLSVKLGYEFKPLKHSARH
ncbi:MAG: outer membrane beta-barrel protein [Bacteroidetes bacterium]|nr:outer membrane beta-barrel protein [Bacteroidota bacterium]